MFPCQRGDKRPAIPAWETRATAAAEHVRAAWAGPYAAANIGIACGPSMLVVIDLDVPHDGAQLPPGWREPGVEDGADTFALACERAGQRLPLETYTVRTPRGGWHLYFTAPKKAEIRNSAGRLAPLVDVRGSGGYVLGAGSVVNGRRYELVHDQEPAALPEWLADALRGVATAPTVGRASRSRPAYAKAALKAELRKVLQAAEGTRNATLNSSAFALGQLVATGELNYAFTWTALLRAAENVGLPTREAEATIRSGLSGGRSHPREAA